MKKEYTAPLVEYLAFSVMEVIAGGTLSGGETGTEEGSNPNSYPWNEGELGWT